ncbi:cache domain-containing protein [Salinarimonas ramus]|uniref:HAMP domain-containing protein n=1 Tax=Salinarimonas ramus TaxID=690164 RepID=A0A917QFZ9_9HYPH|nr:cache domain-containing protein [Salinarimonas ramus]GGK48775.1 hypothetical protein GCM10011322_39770 [Salinarimonas ramus]
MHAPANKTTRPSRRIGLAPLVVVGCAVIILAPILLAAGHFSRMLEERTRAMLLEEMETRAELGSALVGKRLGQLWREVERVAESVPIDDPEARAAFIETVGGVDERYSWLGVADTAGEVLVASRGMLVGESVAQRPWFREGLSGPFAGDVHDAKLLASLLGSADGEPPRFIDFAAPVRRPDGSVTAVVGAHVDWRWVLDNLDALRTDDVEVLLLDRDRRVLAGPEHLEGEVLTVSAALGAGRGGRHAATETWPDGITWVSVTLPAFDDTGLPTFGWSLVLREPAETALAPLRALLVGYWTTLAVASLAALLLLLAGARWLATPLRRLALSAETMTTEPGGRPVHPETRYEEAARLSRALARVQSAMGVRERR